MDDYIWLTDPIHKNFFRSFKPLEDEEVKDTLKVSFDGSIMAVLKAKVEAFAKDKEIQMIRLGLKEYPKKFKIEDKESFYKFLSYHLEVD
tara:strand:+ start:14736 stop:15005 length:270 start_codon:yes stop_codon:yes gene_type:complete